MHNRTVLNAREFGALARVSHSTVYKLLGSGAVKAVKAGKSWRILKSSAESFLRGEGCGGQDKQTSAGQTAQE
jgi:excisionase family DNA binding protein